MEVFTRCARGWHLSRWLDRDLSLTALRRALVAHVPQIHHSDQDFHNAYHSIGRFLDEVYTRKRIHSALGYLTPAEFEAQWQAKQPQPVLE